MATSITYPDQTGAQSTYAIPFEYLARNHVKVTLDGVLLESGVTFLSTFMLSISPAPVGDLKIYRKTPRDETINVYSDGSVLLSDELNASFIQSIFIAQEVGEVADDTVSRGWVSDNFDDGGTIRKGTLGQLAQYTADGNLIPTSVIPDPSTGDGLLLKTVYDPENRNQGAMFPAVYDPAGVKSAVMFASVYDPVGKLVAKLAEYVDVRYFNTVGNGIADDYPAIEAACRAAEGKTLYFPAGTYKLTSGSPRIGSNTRVILSAEAVIVQPNYYSYNRPTVAYAKASVVDWNAFFMYTGTENVVIEGQGSLRGPFYQSSAAGYTANPVQNWPASNGIQVRGHDYEQRKSLPMSQTPAKNITIQGIRIEGFGEDAIQLDQVDNAYCRRLTITRCGRGGIRLYGVVDGWMVDNDISKLGPGDYLNNGNRMYGITATRCYQGDLSVDRASENIWMIFNTIADVPYWKCLDTHGGTNIRFLFNKCYNSHIGIGIDKGGFTAEDGIAPPRNIWVIGNRLIRTLPDDPLEGDTGVAGPAIFAVAHDQTDAQVGDVLIIDDNVAVGWGEDTRFGALTVSNFKGVQIGGKNQLYNSRRSAICIRERFEGDIADGILIDDVRRSSLGVQDGIAIETAEAVGRIGELTFINRQATTLRAIYLSTPTAGKGFKLGFGQVFRALGAGSITKVTNPQNEQSGPWTMGLRSMIRTQTDASVQNSRGDLTFTVAKPVAGQYVYTFTNFAFVGTSYGFPMAVARVNGFRAAVEVTGASEVTVWTRNAAGADTDCSHILYIHGC